MAVYECKTEQDRQKLMLETLFYLLMSIHLAAQETLLRKQKLLRVEEKNHKSNVSQ